MISWLSVDEARLPFPPATEARTREGEPCAEPGAAALLPLLLFALLVVVEPSSGDSRE